MSLCIIGINIGGFNLSLVEGVYGTMMNFHIIENALSQKLTKYFNSFKYVELLLSIKKVLDMLDIIFQHQYFIIEFYFQGRRSRNVLTSPKCVLGLNKEECVEELKYYPSIQVVGASEHPDTAIQEFRV